MLYSAHGQQQQLTDKKFFKCISNTIDDFKKMTSTNETEDLLEALIELNNTRLLTHWSALQLYLLIQIRMENMEYIKVNQDYQTFKTVNKEHSYINKIINKYFSFEEMKVA